jgi:hypothetical protein
MVLTLERAGFIRRQPRVARSRQGMQYVRIALHVTEIDTLIHMGLLKEEQRQDADAGTACCICADASRGYVFLPRARYARTS